MRLLTKKMVALKIGFSVTHLDRLWTDPAYKHMGFPMPTRIGFKRLWCELEVDAWIEAQLAKRRTSP